MSSLLPINSTAQEFALEGAISRISDVPVPIKDTYNPALLAGPLLPWLAWAFSVDEWNATWTDAQKRQVIAASLDVHRHKGTVGALKNALSALGFDITLTEWFNRTPVGDPYTFGLSILLEQYGIPSASIYGDIENIALSAKNVRSYLDYVRVIARSAGQFYAAAALISGETVNVYSDWIGPSLNFDFTTGALDSRITFTRASSATRVNASGLIEIVGNNVPRFDYDPVTLAAKGLLIEGSRTNSVVYSEGISNWSTANPIPVPNAFFGMNGFSVLLTASSGDSPSKQFGGVAAGTYTASFAVDLGSVSGSVTTISIVALVFDADGVSFSKAAFTVSTKAIVAGAIAGNATSVGQTARQLSGNIWLLTKTVTFSKAGTSSRIYCETKDGERTTVGLLQWEAGLFATSYIPSTDTFTSRASSATFIGSNGLIQTAATNVARMQYNPLNLSVAPKLLLEAAATNLCLYSEQLDNAAWSKTNATVAANAIIAPDGTLSVDLIVPNTVSANHFVQQNSTLPNSGTVTTSFYAKNGGYGWVLIECYTGTAFLYASVNIGTGALGTVNGALRAAAPVLVNGMWRVEITMSTAATGSPRFSYFVAAGDGVPAATFTGDGASGIYFWGAQSEPGNFATSYIPTTSAAVTRAADVSSSAATTRAADTAVISTLSPWFNAAAGSFVADTIINTATSGTNRTIFDGGVAAAQAYVDSANSLIFNSASKSSVSGASKLGISYSAAPSMVCVSGSIGSGGTSGAPSFSYLRLGCNRFGGESLNGHIKRISYYPSRLTDAELQLLTA